MSDTVLPSRVLVDLSDDEYEARLKDPSLIQTHKEASAILEELDREIAHIQMQVDAYQIESNGRKMPEDRENWLRRASYAGAMRKNERHRVMQRDRELRKISGPAQTPKKDPEAKRLKQERLLLEAQDRKTAREIKVTTARLALEQAQGAKTYARIFVQVVKEKFEPEIISAIEAEVTRRRANPGDHHGS